MAPLNKTTTATITIPFPSCYETRKAWSSISLKLYRNGKDGRKHKANNYVSSQTVRLKWGCRWKWHPTVGLPWEKSVASGAEHEPQRETEGLKVAHHVGFPSEKSAKSGAKSEASQVGERLYCIVINFHVSFKKLYNNNDKSRNDKTWPITSRSSKK